MMCLHLGESVSVAILERGVVNPNLHLDAQGSPLTAGGTMLRIPIDGRTDALIKAYRDNNLSKVPTPAADKPKKMRNH